jgi:hypothetical protein
MTVKSARGRPSRLAIYRQLAEGEEELKARLGGLPTPPEADDIWGDIWYQEAHNSTAIEGNTLVVMASGGAPVAGSTSERKLVLHHVRACT